MAYREFDLLLGKVQSALGTKQASLAAADFIALDKTFEMKYVQEMVPMNLTAGGMKPQQSAKGLAYCDILLSMPVVPTGSTTAPNVHNLLTCCGLDAALSTNKRTYTPSDDVAGDWKDMSLWYYTGEKASGDSVLTKCHSAMFDLELTFEVGQPLMAKFVGKGAVDDAPAATTIISDSLTLPSVAPCFQKGTTIQISGISYKLLRMTFKINNVLELLKDPTTTYGYNRCDIASRISNLTATVYQNDSSAQNPYTLLDTPTLGTTTITFGTAGSRITLSSGASKTQIVNVDNSDENGIKTWNIEANFVDNSWSLVINDD